MPAKQPTKAWLQQQLDELESRLAETLRERDELVESVQRLKADFDNFRKRTLRDQRPRDRDRRVPVSFPEATLGATVEVPTPDGRVSLKVPPGSQEGRQLRIRGRGMPKLRGGGRGDLIARLHVDVPKKLTPEQRQAVERLAAVLDDDPRAQLRESARRRG
jgi:DnaJ-class molecular chaperone